MRLPRPILLALAGAAVLLAASLAAGVAWTRYAASLGPLDLAASREGSTIVVDRRRAVAAAIHSARRTLASAGDHA